MSTFAKQYAESLAQVSGHTALISDREQFIASAGGYRQLVGKPVSELLDEKLQEREGGIAVKGDRSYITICDEGPTPKLSPPSCAKEM